MTQLTTHPRGGWQQQEIDTLFQAVEDAAQTGKPLRDVFSDVGERLRRKPNSIRNFYYARVHESPELCARRAPFRSFTQEEVHALLRDVLMGRGQGESVRACVTRLAGGDRQGMLRLQNKYRSILKNHPEMLVEAAQELRMEGLPCPENAVACRKYERSRPAPLETLAPHMADPAVKTMVDALTELLSRQQAQSKWQELQRENDRLKVENDLLKIALEDAKSASPTQTDTTR